MRKQMREIVGLIKEMDLQDKVDAINEIKKEHGDSAGDSLKNFRW